ncbi:MAG: DUF427 domain-containing protein [Actinomycetia bacterium]|nr:DUF427 domain-containing protein [Actinomycetes bacterium]
MTTQTRGRVRVEGGQKRVRAQIGGVTVADSADVKMVWEIPYYPTYYFPQDAVRMDLLSDSGETKRSPARGTANLFDISVGDRTIAQAARVWNEAKFEEVEGYVSFDWKSMDAWFEEDEEVYVHARDPYTRIDALQSSRNIRVEVDGTVVADSDRARFLFETGLRVRYYLPKTDVNFEYLTATDTATACPYKGTARYWSIDVGTGSHGDVVWGYDTPLRESQQIAGYVSFYNEKLDIYVDGILEDS